MEEADKLMLRTLRDLDCEIEEDTRTLGQLTTDQIVESVVRCLHIIQPDSQEKIQPQLPPTMSGRFNFGSRLAELCRGLGCPGDLGYQTFLYPEDKQIRNIFLHLLEKLPRQSAVEVSKESSQVKTNKQISQAVDNLLKAKNPPTSDCFEFCACTTCYPSVPSSLGPLFDILPPQTRNSALGETKRKPHCMLASLIETHAVLKNTKSAPSMQDTSYRLIFPKEAEKAIVDAAVEAAAEAERMKTEEREERKMTLLNTLDLPVKKDWQREEEKERSEEENIDSRDDTEDTNTEIETGQQSELQKKQELLKQKEQLESKLLKMLDEYKSLNTNVRSHEQEMDNLKSRDENTLEKLKKSEEEVEKHNKILQLLPNAEENLSKLVGIVTKSKEKLADLESQWEQHKTQLNTEYEDAMIKMREFEQSSIKSKSRGPMTEEKIERMKDEIKMKENLVRNLQKEIESLKSEGKPREFYTNRILELLKQIERLRSGVDKVIEDVKSVQKDINNLNGKLERTFIEITITMEKMINNKEPYIEQSLDITKKIHANANDIVETIRKSGAIGREIRDMEAQIKNEESRDLKSKIGKLSQDFTFLQKENVSLAAELKRKIQ